MDYFNLFTVENVCGRLWLCVSSEIFFIVMKTSRATGSCPAAMN